VSAIANFVKLPESQLSNLRRDLGGTLKTGVEVADYPDSGWVIATVLIFLGEQGVAVDTSEYDALAAELSNDCSISLLTNHHKEEFTELLASSHFTEGELEEFYFDLNQTDPHGVGPAMLAGIDCVKKSLDSLEPGYVVVIYIA